nr:13009_t:CDS:10 [Entrophospora candida]
MLQGSKNQTTAIQKIGDNQISQNQTWNNIKKKWSGVKQDLIELLAKRCLACSSRNIVRQLMANLVDMSPDGEYKYILHACNHFTRYSWGYPLKSKSLIEVAANLFDLFTAFGAQTILQSANGKEVNSQATLSMAPGACRAWNKDLKNKLLKMIDCLVSGIEPRSNDTVLELLFADCYINEEDIPSNITIEGSKNAFEFLDIIIASTSGGVIYNNDDAVNVDINDEASDGTIVSTSSGVSNNDDGGDDEIIASASGGVSNNNNNDDENIVASTDVVINSSSSNNSEDGEYLYIESLDELNSSQNDDYDFDEFNSNLALIQVSELL